MEESTQENGGKAKQWLQDNLRIITSIIIVLVIALGIYSYSKRTQVPGTDNFQEQLTQENSTQETPATVAPEKAADTNTGATAVTTAPSQETEQAFIETAIRGDGMTKLARRALANYLEKNPDSTLTAEHKIYIEDYLRKQVPKKGVFVGTSVEFSKSLIQNAITKSKTLNEKQLQNLHKYAVRVPSLT
ncbi:MAG TPA: hypothetical protein VF390_00525 [Patescibacteria group bacterium]